MIKAIFFDIDGTLVSFRTHEISVKSLETLRSLRKNGVKLFIASGRHFRLMDNLGEFSFDGYICMNGALIYDRGEVVYRHPIDRNDALAVADIADRNRIPCALFSENRLGMNFQNGKTMEIFKMIRLPQPPIIPLREYAMEPVYQYTIFVNGEMEKRYLQPVLKHAFSTRWHPEFTDIIPENLSKAEGIEHVISMYGISRDEVMAFGDGGNDVEMLEYAGIGVAMGNAVPDVQKRADYVTGSVDDEGVTMAVRHFGLL